MKVVPPHVAKAASVKLIQLGVVLMAFGVGGFLGYVVGRFPVSASNAPNTETLTRAELHANNAEYLAHRAIVGVSRLEGRR